MYAQITTRCNMSCDHCCFDCTAEGEDMSLDVFRRILNRTTRNLTIGGGEPTLHPQFWDFMDLAIQHTKSPGIATNGSMTEDAIKLAAMVQQGEITCVLSQDIYHDPIDPRVIAAFQGAPAQNGYPHIVDDDDYRIIRDVAGGEVNSGRCDFGSYNCPCRGPFVEPAGNVFVCGCMDSLHLGLIGPATPIGADAERVCHTKLNSEQRKRLEF
jgi:hypothetical protein